MRALVVDDSAAMRAILRMILKRQGFEMVQARGRAACFAGLAANRAGRSDADRLEHAGDEWIASCCRADPAEHSRYDDAPRS